MVAAQEALGQIHPGKTISEGSMSSPAPVTCSGLYCEKEKNQMAIMTDAAFHPVKENKT